MKKILKTFIIALMAIMLLFVTVQPTVVLAEGSSVDTITSSIKADTNKDANSDLTNIAQTIINFIWVLSIIVSVIVLMILGIKYVVGGVQEKAKYKESLIPVVVGIIVIVSATTIVNFLFGTFSTGSTGN